MLDERHDLRRGSQGNAKTFLYRLNSLCGLNLSNSRSRPLLLTFEREMARVTIDLKGKPCANMEI
jgi:hypothetical protein